MNSAKHVADIERMAHRVGMLPARGNVLTCGNREGVTLDALTRFAALVRAQALEDAARVAETPVSGEQDDITMEAKDRAAAAIRALAGQPGA